MRSLLASKRNRLIVVDGLAGSAASMLFAKLPRRKQPYLIIANDLDEAGYIYNDLCQILDDKQVLIFPSGYKRDIKYGQVDPPNEILRTEVLSKWHSQKGLHCVVTFPEALAEKVCTREMVDKAVACATLDSARSTMFTNLGSLPCAVPF